MSPLPIIQGPIRLFVLRHGERLDQYYSSQWLRQAFDKYSKFGKTQAQLADHNELRIGSAGIQKMMKDCALITSKYTSQLLDNDIARVLGKLTTGTAEAGAVHYPKGT